MHFMCKFYILKDWQKLVHCRLHYWYKYFLFIYIIKYIIIIDAYPITSNWTCEPCNLNTGVGVIANKVYLIGQTVSISIPADSFQNCDTYTLEYKLSGDTAWSSLPTWITLSTTINIEIPTAEDIWCITG